MNFCPYCGTALEGNPLFCPECGAYLLNADEKIAAQNDAAAQNAASQPAAPPQQQYQQQYQQPQPQQQYYQPPVQQEQPQYYQPPGGEGQPFNSGSYQQQQQQTYQGYAQVPYSQPDKTKVGLVIVSFLFPLVGIILFFSKRKKTPKAARSYLIASLISFAIQFYATMSENDEINIDDFTSTSSIVCEADEIPTVTDTALQI